MSKAKISAATAQADRATFARRLLKWYDQSRRDLPWRGGGESNRTVDAYGVLLSEFMLQQTQVATVIPYFHRFISRFPTVRKLAEAQEHEVLRLWQGLGYYARARNLLATARKIVEQFDSEVPDSVEALMSLPGIGRYTAGAIASIAHERRAPILDGNVARVLCRLDCVRDDPRKPQVARKLWERAEEILPRKRTGDFNSAMMELGATICTPRSPRCGECPVGSICKARAAGVQSEIPPPKKQKASPILKRCTIGIRHRSRWLMERRPAKGRWANLWQFVTLPAEGLDVKLLGQKLGFKITELKRIGQISHALSHRKYVFEVFMAQAADGRKRTDLPREWVSDEELTRYPLPRPQEKIWEMLKEARG